MFGALLFNIWKKKKINQPSNVMLDVQNCKLFSSFEPAGMFRCCCCDFLGLASQMPARRCGRTRSRNNFSATSASRSNVGLLARCLYLRLPNQTFPGTGWIRLAFGSPSKERESWATHYTGHSSCINWWWKCMLHFLLAQKFWVSAHRTSHAFSPDFLNVLYDAPLGQWKACVAYELKG